MGLLKNALQSIFNQQLENAFFTIVVIDDESPVSAEQEISSLVIPENCKIELITKKNGGPAKARNMGLDYLEKNNVPIVAFLDSDDVWGDSHIAVAVEAIKDGASFYFCDHNRFDSAGSWFSSLGFLKNIEAMKLKYNITSDSQIGLLNLKGTDCFRLFLQDYFSQTSSIVYKFSDFTSLRFDPLLVSAGEDLFLCLQLVISCQKVSFSLDSNIFCGEGVNIYFDSFDWNKLSSSSQQGYRYLLYFMISKAFDLTAEQSSYINEQKNLFIWRYSYLMIKHLILGKGFNRKLFLSIFNASFVSASLIPFRFVAVTINKGKLSLDTAG